jgi:hypothetical protein
VDLLVTLVQEAAGTDGLTQSGGLISLGLHLLQGIPELHGQWTNARMPLLLCVTELLWETSRILLFFLFAVICCNPDPSL